MADNTKIEWTDATWNPITGCTVVSPGCTNCYAMKLAGTRLKNHPSRKGLTQDTKAGPVWTGEVRFNREWLDQPLRWTKPRMIFVCAHGDLFAEGVPDEWINQVFAVMALCPQHTFQVLTKRPERMREYLTGRLLEHRLVATQVEFEFDIPSPGRWPHLPLPNVWLGVSVEDQQRADERRHAMKELAEKGWLTWVSYEPTIGPVDWIGWEFIRWLVSGGESGPRPSHPDWHRSARDFCAALGIPYLFKQWGSWKPICEMLGEEINSCFRSKRTARPGEDQAIIDEMHGRACIAENTVLHLDGSRHDHLSQSAFASRGAMTVFKVGKKAAGRLLDGIEHNGFPEVR